MHWQCIKIKREHYIIIVQNDGDDGEIIYVLEKEERRNCKIWNSSRWYLRKLKQTLMKMCIQNSNYIKILWDIIDSDAYEWINADIMDREAYENGLALFFLHQKNFECKKI